MEKTSKFGRKRLPLSKKRNIEIKICVNSEELNLLKEKYSGVNFRGKLRHFLLNSDQNTFINDDSMSKEEREYRFELKKIGVNLNQLTYKVNIGEFPIPGETEDLINLLIEKINDKLS